MPRCKSWPRQLRDAFRFIIGSEFDVHGAGDTPRCRLVLLAQNRAGYGNLCELITLARLRARKGDYRVDVRDVEAPAGRIAPLRGLPECLALLSRAATTRPRRCSPRRCGCKTFRERARSRSSC